MDAIETLMNEHRVIERVLDGLVAFADEVQRKGTTEKEELSRFVTFIREFADACHHGKEEDILFAAMVEHGFPRNGGPIAVMLHEHDQGRGARRDPAAARRAARARGATPTGRRSPRSRTGSPSCSAAHIHKEDAVLYPMAEQHLPPEAIERGRRRPASGTSSDEARAGAHERLHALAEELVRATPRPSTPGPPTAAHRFGCCG